MEIVESGIIRDGAIAFDNPLPLQEGCRVTARVEVDSAGGAIAPTQKLSVAEFAALPFFGQWADRSDIVDSADYVRQERAKWQQRATRQD